MGTSKAAKEGEKTRRKEREKERRQASEGFDGSLEVR